MGSLFPFKRILLPIPFVPTAFEGENLGKPIFNKLLCQTGTGSLVASGTVKDKGFFLGKRVLPFIKLPRIDSYGSLDLEFAAIPVVASAGINDDKIGILHNPLERFLGHARDICCIVGDRA